MRELDVSGAEKLESVFKDAMAALLLYTPQCAAQQQTTLAKFWKTIASLGCDVLDRLVLKFLCLPGVVSCCPYAFVNLQY